MEPREELRSTAEEIQERLRQDLVAASDAEDQDSVQQLFDAHHAADFADIIETLDDEHQAWVLHALEIDQGADLLEEMEDGHLAAVTEGMDAERLADVLDQMPSDDAADVIGELEPERQRELLALMEDEESEDVEALLTYPPDTAGGIMQREAVAFNGALTADQCIAAVRELGLDADVPYYNYVVNDQEQLVGVISLRQILTARPQAQVAGFMSTPVIKARVDEDQEVVAQRLRKYDLVALPVVDQNEVLVGLVTFDDVLDVIQDELEEDLAKFAGTSVPTRPRSVLKASVLRLPVVLICLIGDVVAGQVMLRYEASLAHLTVALAAFLPALMATGGNIGQQSLAKTLRAISSGDSVTPGLLWASLRESGIGLLMGLVTGLVLGGLAFVMRPSVGYGLVVLLGAALTITSVVAAVLGAAVPLCVHRLGRDPAIASGPLITTLNDIISTSVYFALALAMLRHLPVP